MTTPALDEEQRRNKSGQAMRRKGQEKRQRLVEATAELLNERSLAQLRVADIVRAAGTSAPNFYLYFDSVLDVVLAAVEQVSMDTPQLLALVQAPWPDEHLLSHAQAFVEAYLAHWQQQAHLLRVRSVLVSEGEERFIAVENEASVTLLLALAEKFDPQRESSDAQPLREQAVPAAGVILAMLDRLAGYLPRAHDRHGATAERLSQAAAAMLALAVRDTRVAPE